MFKSRASHFALSVPLARMISHTRWRRRQSAGSSLSGSPNAKWGVTCRQGCELHLYQLLDLEVSLQILNLPKTHDKHDAHHHDLNPKQSTPHALARCLRPQQRSWAQGTLSEGRVKGKRASDGLRWAVQADPVRPSTMLAESPDRIIALAHLHCLAPSSHI